MNTADKQVLLRSITAADIPALAEFCAHFPDETRPVSFWQQRFDFWWEENHAFSPDFPRGSLLEADGKIGGMFALIPSRIVWNSEERVAANMSCWRVHTALRQHSMKLFLALMEYAQGYPLLNTTPTKDVEALLNRVPFTHFSHGVTTESVIIRPREGGSIWQRIKDIARIHVNWWPNVQSKTPWMQVILSLIQYVRQQQYFKKVSEDQGELFETKIIGSEFDRLWQRTHKRFPVTNVRGSLDLKWYLQKNPNRPPFDLLVHQKNGELVAFGLFTKQPTHHWPDGESYLALDLWTDAPDDENLLPLLGYASNLALKNGITVLRIPHYHPHLAQVCRRAGITCPISKIMTSYYLPPQGSLPATDSETYCSKNMGDSGL
ncbi:MAG: hypothetical protein HQL07_10840 [Nitrospirae bacterium]|nr:hypothetical protein [Magnetococcales bacterium]HAT49491.1 hypothetical protein [Alphaproteobacteria bacterium]